MRKYSLLKNMPDKGIKRIIDGTEFFMFDSFSTEKFNRSGKSIDEYRRSIFNHLRLVQEGYLSFHGKYHGLAVERPDSCIVTKDKGGMKVDFIVYEEFDDITSLLTGSSKMIRFKNNSEMAFNNYVGNEFLWKEDRLVKYGMPKEVSKNSNLKMSMALADQVGTIILANYGWKAGDKHYTWKDLSISVEGTYMNSKRS
ncbi:MAG: hypothetical protein ACQEP1_05130 [Nanobdellota archaeon]